MLVMDTTTINFINQASAQIEEEKAIKKAKRNAKTKAINSYAKHLMSEGIDAELAKVMAKVFYQSGRIKEV